MLKKNMHIADVAIRAVVGIGLIWVGFIDGSLVSSNLVNWGLGGFGVLDLVSAAMAFCPVYFLAGFSTRFEAG